MIEPSNHMRVMLEKLMLAGWVKRFGEIERPECCHRFIVEWAPSGRENLLTILTLINEIESKSGPITDEELPSLKAVAQLAALGNSSQDSA